MARRMRLTDAAVARLQGELTEYTVWDTRTPGLGVRIRPSGGRSYVFQGRAGPDAVARRHTLGPIAQRSVAESRRACLELQTAARPPHSRGVATATPACGFATSSKPSGARPFATGTSPPAARAWKPISAASCYPPFGALRLERITPNAVHRRFDRYSATAPGGANHALRLLRIILRYAVRRGHLPAIPRRPCGPIPDSDARASSVLKRSGGCTGPLRPANGSARRGPPRPTSSGSCS